MRLPTGCWLFLYGHKNCLANADCFGTMPGMSDKKRNVFSSGHVRKFLVVVEEEAPEVEAALAFAANRVRRTGGMITLLYVIEPGDFQHWLGVKEIQREEALQKAKAVFRLFKRKLNSNGFDDLTVEEVVREGTRAEEISSLIQEDGDIAILVLGASQEQSGPGPLISNLVSGGEAGNFPVPISIIPGQLSWEDITSLA